MILVVLVSAAVVLIATLAASSGPTQVFEGVGPTPDRVQVTQPSETPTPGSEVEDDVEVADLVEWAEVAASSDAFMRTLALTFFRQALGRDPTPDENPEFVAMWRALPEDGYALDSMLHRLVDTLAFGAPR